MSVVIETPTLEAIKTAMHDTYAQLSQVLATLSDPLPDSPDAGGWTIRRLLSHIAGAYQRVPVHSGFVLGGSGSVPIVIGDDYWIAEWEEAPLRSFQLAIEAGYQGCRALVDSLEPADLQIMAATPFGEMNLGSLLMLSLRGHIGHFHLPQLVAFSSN